MIGMDDVIAQIDKQLDGLLVRIVETDNPSVIAAYEKKIEKLETDKVLLADKRGQNAQPKHTLDEIFELSMQFLANPWNIWVNGNLTLKKTVLRMVFKAPLVYDKESGFRTPQPSVIFGFLEDITANCKMVRSNGLGSNSISSDFEGPATGSIEPISDDLFDELERWNDVLKYHKDELRGPRP